MNHGLFESSISDSYSYKNKIILNLLTQKFSYLNTGILINGNKMVYGLKIVYDSWIMSAKNLVFQT